MQPIARHSVIAILLAAASANAADIGTLFYSPEQRAKMDRLRRGEPVTEMAQAGGVTSRRPEVTGYVQRSDGRNTVWIDGRPVVIASPAAKDLLDPRLVHPQPPDDAIRIEERGEAKDDRKPR